MFPNFYTYGFGGRLGLNFKKYNQDYEVEVWRVDSSVKCYLEKEIENVIFRIFPAKGNSKIGLYSYKFLKELFKLEPKTILNVQNIHTMFYYQILFFAKRKLILTAHHHGEWSPYFRTKWFTGIRKIYSYLLLFLENLLINRTDFFFIIDKRQLSYLAENVHKLDDRVSLSNSGCDFEKFNNIDENTAKQLLGLSLHKKYLFYVGQYYEYKEVDRLCVIYLKLKKVRPDVELMVAGGTSKDKYYKNLIECGAINFGRILNSELYKYYSAASAYISMTFREDWFGGIGIAMIESLACGTPVISKSLYNLPDPDEIKMVGRMPDNENQMIEDILYVLEHPDEFKNCRLIAQKYYDYKNFQKEFRNVYERLHTMKN